MLTASVENMLVTSIDTTLETGCCSIVNFCLGSQKMDRFVDRLKRRIVFSRWYPTCPRKLKKD